MFGRRHGATQRFWLADYIGGDFLEDGWYVYLGPLMVRWQRRRRL